MGLMDIFKKKTRSEADTVREKIQMVDSWIVQKKKTYRIQFDATVPTERGRRKEISKNDYMIKSFQFEEKIEKLTAPYEIGVGLYDLYEMHKWMQVYGTTMFWLISFTPSTVVKNYVMFSEAVTFFDTVFMKMEPLCKEIQERLQENLEKLKQGDTVVFEDYQDAENCEKLMTMMLQLYEYFDFLLKLAADIYANAPYLVDEAGNYMGIENVEKTFANVLRMIHAENRNAGCITQEQFMELVE